MFFGGCDFSVAGRDIIRAGAAASLRQVMNHQVLIARWAQF